jgi:hypothetical protein
MLVVIVMVPVPVPVPVVKVVIVEIGTTPAHDWFRCAIDRAERDFVNMSCLGYHC